MSINPDQMRNEELHSLLVTECNKFVEGLSSELPYKTMRQIRDNVRAIKSELEKRNAAGQSEPAS